jgi:hypothetical protein
MLLFHIIAGSFVLLFGIGALIFSKGEKLHRYSGNLFFFSLLLMAGSGAYFADDPTIAISSVYFASTAWVIVLMPEKKIGVFDIVAFIVISVISANFFYAAITSEPGFMVTMFYIFGSVALLAALLDLNMIIRGGISGAHRIARHLWRMCYALLGAVLSFVANTSDKWPNFIDANLPIYLLILIIFYWLIRVLFTKWFDKRKDVIGKGSTLLSSKLSQ